MKFTKLIFVTTTTILKEFSIYMGLELEYNDFEEKKIQPSLIFLITIIKKIDFEKKRSTGQSINLAWLSLICLCVHHLKSAQPHLIFCGLIAEWA